MRDLFDGVVEKYPDTAKYLNFDAEIVNNPAFESAIVKVLNKVQEQLTPCEQDSIRQLRQNSSLVVNSEPTFRQDKTFAENILLNKRRRIAPSAELYIDARFVMPTSNIVERLFSRAKIVLNDRRQSLYPVNFEMLLFLNANNRLWDVYDVEKAQRNV